MQCTTVIVFNYLSRQLIPVRVHTVCLFFPTLYICIPMDITNFDTTLMSMRLIVSFSFTCCKKVWQKINEIKRETSS